MSIDILIGRTVCGYNATHCSVIQIHTLRTGACQFSAVFASGYPRATWGLRRPSPAIPPMSECAYGALPEKRS
jgi:hypothetical protein